MKIIHGFNCHMKIWKVWRDPQQGKQSTLWLDETKIQTPKEKSLKPGRIFLSHFPQCAFHGAWQNVKFTVLVTNRLELQHNNACSNSTSMKLLWPSARLRLSILRRVMQQLLAIQSSESGIAEDVGEMVFLVPGICLSNFLLASINGHATYTAACSQKKKWSQQMVVSGFFFFLYFSQTEHPMQMLSVFWLLSVGSNPKVAKRSRRHTKWSNRSLSVMKGPAVLSDRVVSLLLPDFCGSNLHKGSSTFLAALVSSCWSCTWR